MSSPEDPGRDLDRMVAERLGWKALHLENNDLVGLPSHVDGPRVVAKFCVVPHFSTDINAAMELVEILRRKTDGHFTLMGFTTNWRAAWVTPDVRSGHGFRGVEWMISGKTAAHAIALAAWKRPIPEPESDVQVDLTTEFGLEDVRKLIASGDDSTHTQLRVTRDGIAFLSKVVGGEDLGDLAFRLETFASGNGYVGPDAANDDEWIGILYKCLKKHWPHPSHSYIDVF